MTTTRTAPEYRVVALDANYQVLADVSVTTDDDGAHVLAEQLRATIPGATQTQVFDPNGELRGHTGRLVDGSLFGTGILTEYVLAEAV